MCVRNDYDDDYDDDDDDDDDDDNNNRGALTIILERRGSAVVSTSACHADGQGSLPGPGTLLGVKTWLSTTCFGYRPYCYITVTALSSVTWARH